MDQFTMGTLIYYAEENGAPLKDILKSDPTRPRKRKIIKPRPTRLHKLNNELEALYRSAPPRPTERVYRIAINKEVVNKNLRPLTKKTYSNFYTLNSKFRNVTLTLDEMIDQICNKGYAYCCAQLKDESKRNNENFKFAEIFAIDVDDGLTIDEALELDVTSSALFLYTTANHRPDKHRFRIVFDLPRPVSDPETYKAIVNKFIALYGSDRNTKDEARIFYGFDGAEVINIRTGETR
jgi:hypothetical protein